MGSPNKIIENTIYLAMSDSTLSKYAITLSYISYNIYTIDVGKIWCILMYIYLYICMYEYNFMNSFWKRVVVLVVVSLTFIHSSSFYDSFFVTSFFFFLLMPFCVIFIFFFRLIRSNIQNRLHANREFGNCSQQAIVSSNIYFCLFGIACHTHIYICVYT